MSHSRLLRLALTLTFAGIAARAQDSFGNIAGAVKDVTGAAVAGVRVRAINVATNVAEPTVTSSDGIYNILNLVPGDYRVEFAKEGFDLEIVPKVEVQAGQTASLNASLRPGSVSTRIEVTGGVNLLNTTSSEVATTVGRELTADLPLMERNSLEAAMLVPGVRGDPNSYGQVDAENAGIYTGNIAPGAATNVSGGMPGTTAILIDGSNVTQASIGRTAASVSGDMIQEVTVVTNGVPAKYGNTGGGVIIQATRSGTNEYHGGFTWRHTDPFFNAWPVGQTIPNAEHQNFFGAYLGGPVILPKIYNGKNRTFVYGGYEPARLYNATTALATIPTPQELQGNFTNAYTLINTTILSQQGLAAALAAPRTGNIYFQSPLNSAGFPTGAQYSSSSLYVPVPNDDLSKQLAANKFASWLLNQFPTPTNPNPFVQFLLPSGFWNNSGYNASVTRAVQNTDDRYSFRLDHEFSDKDRFFVRFSSQPLTAVRAYAFPLSSPLARFPTDNAAAFVVSLSETHIVTPTMVNELKIMYARNHQVRGEPPAALTQDYGAAYGLVPAVLGAGFPVMTFSSYNQVGTAGENAQVDSNFQYGDSVTWTKGRHTIGYGVDVRFLQSNQFDNAGLYGGSYGFAANQTNNGSGGNAIASFILGSINTYTNTPLEVPAYYRWRYYAGYVQDDWRIAPRVTVNLGVRYEFQTPRIEKYNNQGTFLPGMTGTLNGIAATGAFCFSGACGLGNTLWPSNYKGFEPRVGIAWAPNDRWSIRANYDIMRVPLTGYGNTPLPDFNVSSSSVGGTTGGVVANQPVNYITNPIATPLTSAYTALGGARGPFFTVQGVTVPYIEQNSAVPYIQQWGLTVQTTIDSKTLAQVGYTGTVGIHLISTAAPPLNFPDLNRLFSLIQSGSNFSSTNIPNPYGITQKGAVIQENLLSSLNPYQNFFNQPLQEQFYRNGQSNYHSLYAGVSRRLADGLTFQSSFTWSKSIDNAGGSTTTALTGSIYGNATVQDPFNLRLERAVSNYDTPLRLAIGYSYQVPLGKGKLFDAHNPILNAIIGGWVTSGNFNTQGGMPFLIESGNSGYWVSSTGTSVLPTGILLRPDLVPGQPCLNPAFSYSNEFGIPFVNPNGVTNPGSFLHPAFGDAPRTLTGCRSPALVSLNASLQKRIRLGSNEKRYLQLQMDALNAFNSTLFFYNPNSGMKAFNNFSSSSLTNSSVPAFTMQSSYGELSQANSALMSRVVLLSAKLYW
jgi:outer membrane receptor protein involved in Fe transport